MFRRFLATMGLSVGCLSSAFAGIYMGPLVSYESIKAGGASYEGYAPRLTLGYGDYVRDAVWLAGELLAGVGTINHNYNPSPTVSLKTSYSYGASILPGVGLDNTLLAYGRIGVMRTRFSNLQQVQNGYQLGLGLQAKLTDVWNMRAEYSNIKYRSMAGVGRPTADQYSIGLVYKWT
jgi:hypothetical protein